MSLAWHIDALRRKKQLPSHSRLVKPELKVKPVADPEAAMFELEEAERLLAEEEARNRALLAEGVEVIVDG